MAWNTAVTGLWSHSNTVTLQQTKLEIIADCIVSASANWSHSGSVVYDTNRIAIVLTHTDTAQLCIQTSTGTGTTTHANNTYRGSALGDALNPVIAYKDPGASSFPTIDNTNNPKDLSTFCSGADSYRFWRMLMGADAGDDNFHSVYKYPFYAIAHDTTSGLFLAMPRSGTDIGISMVFCLPDGVNPDDPSDTYTSVFGIIDPRAVQNDESPVGAGAHGLKVQFRDDTGTIIEDGVLKTRSADLDFDYEFREPSFAVQREAFVLLSASSYTPGRKGIIDPQQMWACRADLAVNSRINCEGASFLHHQNGTVTAWGADDPPLQ